MIHGNSNHPVLIKKISLKVWTLRDEVESVIAGRAEDAVDDVSIEGLKEEYKQVWEVPAFDPKEPLSNKSLSMPTESSAEDSEGGEKAETETEEETPDNVIILQRRPDIPEDKQVAGRVLLGEIYMDRMFFFCDRGFLEGQSIVLEFDVPKRFILNADVIYCKQYNRRSRIISKTALPYRCAVNFTFLKPGERTLLRRFLESVEPDLSESMKQNESKKQAAAQPDDDGFDELDELGL